MIPVVIQKKSGAVHDSQYEGPSRSEGQGERSEVLREPDLEPPIGGVLFGTSMVLLRS